MKLIENIIIIVFYNLTTKNSQV